MFNFKTYFLSENIYRDQETGRLVYKINPKEMAKLGDVLEDNQQLVVKELFLNTTIKGNMSTYIPTKQAKLFIGYDVYTTSTEQGKEIRNSIYATIKGSSNLYKDATYDKPFQAMPKEDYEMLINRAVDAFINTVTAPYDFILFPSSRSVHAKDIAEAIDKKLKTKFASGILQKRAQNTVVQVIPKKLVTPETMKEVVHIEELINKIIFSIEQHINAPLNENTKNSATELLTKTLVDFLYNKASSAKEGTEFSTATHLRSTSNEGIFKKAINVLNSGNIAPELQDKLVNFKVAGHLDAYSDSHFVVEDLIKQLNEYINTSKSREWIGATRILAVDDNINSGDMYKQLSPLGNVLKYCDYFFLMKDMKYKI